MFPGIEVRKELAADEAHRMAGHGEAKLDMAVSLTLAYERRRASLGGCIRNDIVRSGPRTIALLHLLRSRTQYGS
jgi:hypothetical protein